ncbi:MULTISPECIES: hypothetical protein [unclassified Desertifilum]|uniref:Uncharacterized protein n=1 Tax=Desertifilum tharense IPPAS B-1220 TaxID=1781255 RepID=A0ACD5GSI3_9CYAN|nr:MULTISPECIES: hypothetical protein [unclassified Desertifilum]MBD2322216.1 hypothetical protein [Desertifilum sp. FACHB-866]MBD2332253.1 hypothetical protein [Desertifilum sp. FACHB-868]MCD8485762.1 hypothetical protein [Desertifilum sp.]MDI9637857.1 hypothetical protein [Geitlerinema splendidum]
MRYSIMLQIASAIALILVGGSALFAWVQSRPASNPQVDLSRTEAEERIHTLSLK